MTGSCNYFSLSNEYSNFLLEVENEMESQQTVTVLDS